MLAHLTQCVLSMLSICRCAYAHMTNHISRLDTLVLAPSRPVPARGCRLRSFGSQVPAHTGSSSLCIAAAMPISIVLVNMITAAAESTPLSPGAHLTGGSMLLRSDAVKNKSRARTATNAWMCVGGGAESHTCTGSLDMCTHNICICRIMITHRSPWHTRLSRGAAVALYSRGS